MKGLLKSLAVVAVVIALAVVAVPAVDAAYTRDLTIGSTGSDVAELQAFLVSKGFLVMPVGVTPGYFGALTQAAVARYQVANGIVPPAGYFGPLTRASVASMGTTAPVAGLPAGCSSTAGFSPTTGVRCDSGSSGHHSLSLKIINQKSLYYADQRNIFNVEAFYNNNFASPDRGFDLKVELKLKAREDYEQLLSTEDIQIFYDYISQKWGISFVSPTGSEKEYRAVVSIYCASPSKGCSYGKELKNDFSFKISSSKIPRLELKEVFWQNDRNTPADGNSIINRQSNIYYHPRLSLNNIFVEPHHDTDTATEWCKSISGKNYTHGESQLSNKSSDTKYLFDGRSWVESKGEFLSTKIVCNEEEPNIATGSEIDTVGELETENVRCVFMDSSNLSKSESCYTYNSAWKIFMFSGQGSARGEVSGYKNEKLTWKSTCSDDIKHTKVDGKNEIISFKCTDDSTTDVPTEQLLNEQQSTGSSSLEHYTQCANTIISSILSNRDVSEWQLLDCSISQNQVLYLPGGSVNNYVSIPYFPINYSSGFSIEAWIKPKAYYDSNSENPNGPITIISKGQIGSNWEYNFRIFNTGRLAISSTNSEATTCSSVIKLNEWQHVAVTVDRSNNVKFYVNGEEKSTCGSASFSFTSTNQITQIGRGSHWPTASWYFDSFKGEMDEIRFWNKVLTSNQIVTNMKKNYEPGTSSLLGYWKFDDITARDYSGNNNHGISRGAAAIYGSNELNF